MKKFAKFGVVFASVTALGGVFVPASVPVFGSVLTAYAEEVTVTPKADGSYIVEYIGAADTDMENKELAPQKRGFLNPGESIVEVPVDIPGWIPTEKEWPLNYDIVTLKEYDYIGLQPDGTTSIFFAYEKDPNYVAPPAEPTEPATPPTDGGTTPPTEPSPPPAAEPTTPTQPPVHAEEKKGLVSINYHLRGATSEEQVEIVGRGDVFEITSEQDVTVAPREIPGWRAVSAVYVLSPLGGRMRKIDLYHTFSGSEIVENGGISIAIKYERITEPETPTQPDGGDTVTPPSSGGGEITPGSGSSGASGDTSTPGGGAETTPSTGDETTTPTDPAVTPPVAEPEQPAKPLDPTTPDKPVIPTAPPTNSGEVTKPSDQPTTGTATKPSALDKTPAPTTKEADKPSDKPVATEKVPAEKPAETKPDQTVKPTVESQATTASTPTAKTLPNTGEASSILSLVGLGLMGLSGLIKRRR